jgi:Family of unknown function (DUF6516)
MDAKRADRPGHDLALDLRVGERLIGYDNEPGKGDHRHYGSHQEPYQFTSPERLIADFLADLHAALRTRRH